MISQTNFNETEQEYKLISFDDFKPKLFDCESDGSCSQGEVRKVTAMLNLMEDV